MTAPALRWRVHRVTCELDVRGEIDSHAAMCLRQAIEAAQPATIEMILIDLRDLTAVNADGLALLTAHHANCHARGIDMGVLISGHERNDLIAEAFVLAGLGDTLHWTHAPPRTPPARPVTLPDHAHDVRRGRLASAARRLTERRPHSARPS